MLRPTSPNSCLITMKAVCARVAPVHSAISICGPARHRTHLVLPTLPPNYRYCAIFPSWSPESPDSVLFRPSLQRLSKHGSIAGGRLALEVLEKMVLVGAALQALRLNRPILEEFWPLRTPVPSSCGLI